MIYVVNLKKGDDKKILAGICKLKFFLKIAGNHNFTCVYINCFEYLLFANSGYIDTSKYFWTIFSQEITVESAALPVVHDGVMELKGFTGGGPPN